MESKWVVTDETGAQIKFELWGDAKRFIKKSLAAYPDKVFQFDGREFRAAASA